MHGCLAALRRYVNFVARSRWGKFWFYSLFSLLILVVAWFKLNPTRLAHREGTADRVQIASGIIEGFAQNDGIRVFRGIPFAEPPLGELRWRPPQPVKPWTGTRKADRFGHPPMQPAIAGSMFGATPSEDCLYLNVWTAAKDATERRPVMVWIYGGAFKGGGTGDVGSDGANLAKKGVVLVNFNYRVGVFGFLAHPDLSAESGVGSGCYGIQDQIAALRWVRENISQFGGDPNRITIFGCSSGGTSVSILAQSPEAKGLFHRAICESGGAMAPIKYVEDATAALIRSLSLAEEQGKFFLASLGVKDIKEARALSSFAIMKGKLAIPWPVADGQTIVGDPFALYQSGRFNDTPVIVGSTSNDGGLFGSPVQTPGEFKSSVHEIFAENAEAVLAAYPHQSVADASRSARDLIREALFGWPCWAWAKLQCENGKSKAYLYYFDYGAAPGEAAHGSERPYVFGNLGGSFQPAATPENYAMSDIIMSYWVNFAATGNPNGPGLPHWHSFDNREMKAMTFSKSCESKVTPNLAKLQAFDAYWARLRAQRSQ